MKRWKAWEKETQTTEYLVANGMQQLFSVTLFLFCVFLPHSQKYEALAKSLS